METYMVQSVGITGAEVNLPRFYIHRNVSCQWPYTSVVLTTQEDPMPIRVEMLPLDVEVLEDRVYS